MRITVLAENTSCNPDIKAEHGLSLLIETGEKKILFDAGQTDLFYENAVKLGVDLTGVDFAVLSHGHYDHGGGMKKFLAINPTASLYLSCYAFGQHYHGTERYIGLDPELEKCERLVFTDGDFRIDENTVLYSPMNKVQPSFAGGTGMNVRTEDGFFVDSFRHEQYLVIEENGKRYLFSGCSHSGIINAVEWFAPDVLVGGFHLSKIDSAEFLLILANRLDAYNTEFYTCHCTGVTQYDVMKKRMQKLNYISAGVTIEI